MSIIMLLLICSFSCFSQVRPTVKVKFRMTEQKYIDLFNRQNNVGYINSTVSDSLCSLLNDYFPFIEFTTASDPDSLVVTLGRNILATGVMVNTELKMIFLPVENKPVYSMSRTFRTADQDLNGISDNKDAFVSTLYLAFIDWLDHNDEAMVNTFFSKVKLCSKAEFIADKKTWILPFSRDDLQMGDESQLDVVATISSGGNITCRYRTIAQGTSNNSYAPDFCNKIMCGIDPTSLVGNCGNTGVKPKASGVYINKFNSLVSVKRSPLTNIILP